MLRVGVGIYSPAAVARKLLHAVPSAYRALVVIYAVGVALAELLARNTLDAAPVYLQTGSQNQKIIVYRTVL